MGEDSGDRQTSEHAEQELTADGPLGVEASATIEEIEKATEQIVGDGVIESSSQERAKRQRTMLGAQPATFWTAVGALAAVAALVISLVVYLFGSPADTRVPAPAATVSDRTPPADAEPSPSASPYHAGWGPERDTFTVGRPAHYAVLNSITDDPNVGDQRNFVRMQIKGAGALVDFVRVKPGDVLLLSVLVANNAADNLDGPSATIHGLEARFHWPAPGQDIPLSVTLSGKNVIDVWDGVTVLADEPVVLHPIAGTLHMRTNAGVLPIAMGEAVTAVTLGWDGLDGEFPVGYSKDGTYRGLGYLEMELIVKAAE